MVSPVLTAPNLILDNNVSNQTITLLRLRNKLESYLSHIKSLTLHNIFFNPRYHEENDEMHFPIDQDAGLSNIHSFYAIKLPGLNTHLKIHYGLDFQIKRRNEFYYSFGINKISCGSLPDELIPVIEKLAKVSFHFEHEGTHRQRESQVFKIIYTINDQKHGEIAFYPQKDGRIKYQIHFIGTVDSLSGYYERSEWNIRNRFEINENMFLLINHKEDLDIIEVYYKLDNMRIKVCSLPIAL